MTSTIISLADAINHEIHIANAIEAGLFGLDSGGPHRQGLLVLAALHIVRLEEIAGRVEKLRE